MQTYLSIPQCTFPKNNGIPVYNYSTIIKISNN